jgi:hypothetical protein
MTLSVSAPSFTLSTGSASIGQGGSGTTTVQVLSQYGFAGTVNLAVTGLPSGVTASFTPNPTTGTSLLTLNASSTASRGQYTATITGTSGSLTASTPLSLAISAPSFTLSAGSASIGQGTSGSSYVYVNPQYGFTGSVNLAVTGLPAGVTASFAQNPIASGSTMLTLTASSTAAPGTTTLTITGTSGSLTASTTLNLIINAPSFTLTDYSSIYLGQGNSAASYVDVNPQYGFAGSVNLAVTGLPSGVTASFSPNPTTSSSTLTLIASSTAATGGATLTITGTSGSLTASTTVAISVSAPGFTLLAGSVSVGLGSSSSTYVDVSPQYGFTGSVNLAVTGLPSGVTASFSPNPTTGTSTLTLTASSTAALGQYTATITGTSGSLTATTTVSGDILAPSFTLSDYSSVSIGQAGSATSTVTLNPQNGFNSIVHLSVTGLPSGVTAAFAPASLSSGSSTLTLTATATAAVGQYNLIVTGTSGSQTASTSVSLTVYAPSFTLSDYSGVSVGQGSSGTSYVYLSPQPGFTGSVNLAVSGLPNGVTASFSPNPVSSGSSLMTLTAGSSASLGQYNLTITGTSGSLTAATTITVSVYAPSFTLNAGNVAIGQGTSGSSYVDVTGQYGFSGSVHLVISGLPSGVTAAFGTNPTTGSSTLTFTASSTAALGQYYAVITGTSGSLSASTTLTLGVYVPSFTLTDYSAASIGQGGSTTSYVYVNPLYGFTGNVSLAVTGLPSGVTAAFGTNPTTGTSVLTLTASSTASLGEFTATIIGTSGSQSASTTLPVSVYAPTFAISAGGGSIGQGSSLTTYVEVGSEYGFSGSVTLTASGLPSGVTAAFSPNPTTGYTTLTLTASSTASIGQYTVIITGTSGSISASTSITLGVYPPTFTLSDYQGVVIDQGASGTSTVQVIPQYGFAGSVSLAASGLPSGVTASFAPNPTSTGSSVLTLTASNPATTGTFTITITGTSGSASATTTVSLTVYPETFTLAAAPTEITVFPGGSAISTIYVTPQYGFTSSVALAASGLPSGVTASFAPNPASPGSSVLTLTAGSSATPGVTTAIITGTSGALTLSVPIAITVVGTAPAATSTTLAVTSAGAPATSIPAGSVVTLTAAVRAGTTPLTTGQVRFCDATAAFCEDAHLLGTAQLTSAGTATLKFIPGIGSHSYQAVFAGTQSYTTSTSNTAALAVTAAIPTTTAIAQSGSQGNYTLTATVTAQGPLPPTGNVSFQDISSGNAAVGTAALQPNSTALTWLNPSSPATGSEPWSIASGDFNGDGIPDLAVANSNGNSVTILLGKGDGTFTQAASVPTGIDPVSIAVADFNGDGKLDLAVANLNSDSVTILLGNGDGTFTAAASPPTGYDPCSIAVGDFNRDGVPDLAVANEENGTVTILLGNGDGTFTAAANPAVGSFPRSVVVADFNGDGIPDLAVANEDSDTITILLGNGDGTFTASPVSPPTGSDPTSIAIADFNGDGKPDLAVANEENASVTILLGNGDGTFSPFGIALSTSSLPVSIAAADFNGDGKIDLAVSTYYGYALNILLGNGDGTFTAAATQSVGTYPWGVVAADFTGHGSPGLAVVNSGSNTVTVLTSQLAQTATATATGASPVGHGVHLVDANYAGDIDYASSISTTIGLSAQPAAPTVTVTPSASRISTTQGLTVTVAVSGGAGNPTPTGSVTLTSGSYSPAPASLSNGSATFLIPAGTLASGADALNVSYTPDSNSSSTYDSSTGSNSVTVVVPAAPTITWATPAPIPYGTALSSTQLDASSTVAGSFAYSPALGTVLAAGQQTLTTTFTPTDPADYTTATASVTLIVNKATPAIAWATPAAIAYGTALSATQLDASSTVAGSFAYSSALGTVLAAGQQTLTATFTPTDPADYTTATASVTLTVTKATPTVVVTPSPSMISIWQPLSVTVAVSGNPAPTGSVKLASGAYTSAATALAGGSATVNIPGGSLPIGADTLTATYTPDSSSSSNYNSASGSNSVSVTALIVTTLTLSANPTSSTVGQQVTLSATLSPYSAQTNSTNGESIAFSNGSTSLGTGTLSSGVATLTVTALPIGTDSLTAAYAGDPIFNASASNSLPYIVSPLTPTISFSVPNHTYGDAPFSVTATSNSSGAITYSVVSGPATIANATVTLTGAGTVVLQASQAAAGNYAAATQNASFPVAAAAQTITFAAPPSPVNYGTAPVSLSATASSGLAVTFSVLSGPASISGSALTITGAGTVVVAADQPGNSNFAAAAEVTHSITVNKAAPSAGLTASPNPVLLQNAVSLTATVSSSAGTPTGSVAFSDSGTTLATAALNGGIASLSIATLAAGSHSITAVYSGDANFTSVSSAAVAETVQDFTLATGTGSSSQTVQPGGTATYTLPMSPSGGATFPAAVTFSATGLPAGFSATFSPQSLAAGSSATNVTLTIQVPQSATLERIPHPGRSLPLMAIGFLLLPFATTTRRSHARLRRLAAIVVLLAGAGGVATLIGCGGGGGGGGGGNSNPSQTYSITVTATSGALSHSTVVSLTVQ